ncbi:MAG: sigma-70 family RNA polymerase sigma factor [Thermoanaerobaculia bacterium]
MIAAVASSPPLEDARSAPWTGTSQLDLSELFQQHHQRIFNAAYRVTGSASDAEDVLQTVFLRLLRREEAPTLHEGAASYFYRAAVNAALDLLRSRRRDRAVNLEEVSAGLADEGTDQPERLASSKELGARLRQALGTLSPRAAEIFSLRYFEGLGNQQIAELLGTSQTAIAVILHRSRSRLGKQLSALVSGHRTPGGTLS